MTGKYITPVAGMPGLEHFCKLTLSHRREILELAQVYMSKLENIRCPWCDVNTAPNVKKHYEANNLGCNRCWLDCVDRLSLETANSEGWHDGR